MAPRLSHMHDALVEVLVPSTCLCTQAVDTTASTPD